MTQANIDSIIELDELTARLNRKTWACSVERQEAVEIATAAKLLPNIIRSCGITKEIGEVISSVKRREATLMLRLS